MTNKDNVLTAKKSEATKRILKDNESETKSGENLEPSSKIQKLDRGEKDKVKVNLSIFKDKTSITTCNTFSRERELFMFFNEIWVADLKNQRVF